MGGKVTGRAKDAELAYKKVLARYEEAKKLCARLKKEGEEVPEEGEKDYAAPGAYKSPGKRAAEDRNLAKKALAKAKAEWEKVMAPATAKEERLKMLKEKIADAKK